VAVQRHAHRVGKQHGEPAVRATLRRQLRAAGAVGETASTLDITSLERAIRQAILDFEPRILAGTLRIRSLVEESELDHHNVIGVEIQGQVWAQPVPLELLLRTEIDLETGKVHLVDLASRGA
jgi:type VI secretion system protein ImpF